MLMVPGKYCVGSSWSRRRIARTPTGFSMMQPAKLSFHPTPFFSQVANHHQEVKVINTMLSPKSKPFIPISQSDHDGYELEDKVILKNKSEGIIKYIGDVKDNPGVWIGIELTSHHQGRHDGTRDDITYFECESGKGLLIQSHDISRKVNISDGLSEPGSPNGSNSTNSKVKSVKSSPKGSSHSDDQNDDVLSETDDDEDTDSGNLIPSDPPDMKAQLRSQDTLYRVLKPKTGTFRQMDEAVRKQSGDALRDDHRHNIQPSLSMQHERSAELVYNETTLEHEDSIMKSTLKKEMRAWVDPWECAVQDTFYHKQIDQLRPTFEVLNQSLFEQPRKRTAGDMEHNDSEDSEDRELAEHEAEIDEPQKIGPWDGVMASCLLCIFGVIMFLRVGFVVGNAGIVQALLIMAISALVVVLTALSMSAICTNGTILAGGPYYIISRALGPSVGGAIGLLFSLGNMVACSMYLIGFAETLVDNLAELAGFQIFADPVMDVRIWSNVVLCFVLVLAIVGLKYVIKANLFLLAFLVCAICLLFVGSMYRTESYLFPNPDYDGSCSGQDCPSEFISKVSVTPEGWTNGNFIENLSGDYSGDCGIDKPCDFWGILAIFFPAVTGIMAGANISGDLRNPSSDIPKGTLWAIGVSTVVYMGMAVMVGAVTTRYQLIDDFYVMTAICVWDYLVLIGIYAASLSSAIASLVGAPRILQAVANDGIFPWRWLSFFAVADKDGNPIRGYFLSFAVAFCCNLIGALNAIAPLISQFFMLTYLLINFSCFSLEISKSPGWRPSFKYFNKYTAGFGSFLCLSIMFLLDWAYALVASVVALLLYLYVQWTDPEVNWGAAPQARKYYSAYKAILRLRKTKSHVKNWRPGYLVLVRDPIKRAQMMLFAQTLKKAHGPTFYATVHVGDYRTNIRRFQEAHSLGYLPVNAPKGSKGFYEAVLAENFRSGVQNLFQLVGMGSLRPNTLIIGYKRNWPRDSDDVVLEYVQVLRDTLVMGMGLMMVVGFKRINWFLDEYAPPALQHDVDEYSDTYHGGLVTKGGPSDNEMEMEEEDMDETAGGDQIQEKMAGHLHAAGGKRKGGYGKIGDASSSNIIGRKESEPRQLRMPRNHEEEDAAIFLAQNWSAGQGKDTVVDVWWMIDDGGLCMLIPYILKLHKFWSRCKLRLLMVAEEEDLVDIDSMRQLIAQFRLPYEGPFIVKAKAAPRDKTVSRYEKLAKCKLSDTARPSVVSKWLILSDLLFENSRYSGLNVVTLPIPSKRFEPRAYMALLNMLSDQKRLPPTIIMRGNGESTLTFYSE